MSEHDSNRLAVFQALQCRGDMGFHALGQSFDNV